MAFRRIVAWFFVSILVACAPGVAPTRDRLVARWPEFRLNRGNNATLPGTLRTAWSLDTGGAFSASPAVVDGTLYVGNNAGRFVAVDVASGRERWHVTLPSALMSGPLVIGAVVIVGEGDENSMVRHGVVHVGEEDDALVALDRRSGAIRWRTPLAGTAMPTAAYVGGRILAHDGNGDLLSLAPEDGKIAFTRNLGTIPSMVAVKPLGGDVVATAGQTETAVVAVRSTDGSNVWRTPFPGGSGLGDCPLASDGPRLLGDYLMPLPGEAYVRPGRRDEERAYALDARTGARMWNVHLETGIVPTRNQAAIPLVDGATLYVGSSVAAAVHALDARTGRLRWRRRVGGIVKGGLVATGGVLYFGDASGRIWALRERDGSIVGVANAGTPFNVGSPVVVGGTLVMASMTGRIVAFPLAALRGSRDRAGAPGEASRRFAPSVLARFEAGDRDRDGVLQPGEFARVDAPAPFARFDRNGDGVVDPLEFGTSYVAANRSARVAVAEGARGRRTAGPNPGWRVPTP